MLAHPIGSDGVLGIRWIFHTNPDGIYLFDGIVIGPFKFGLLLCGHHSSAVKYTTGYNVVAGIKFFLAFYVDN